jgi:phenylacetate-coenzyme A ligase PaaK-like adenylate-forming protein
LRIFDVYGSTENPITAAQIDPDVNGLAMFLNTLIPEIASPDEVLRCKDDPETRVEGVHWDSWKKGMKGELILTRPGRCLPLVRYPTGDVIEVLDPVHEFSIDVQDEKIRFNLPLIRVLGRSVETLDFETKDEAGNFLGIKIYSRFVNEALHRSTNVMWWELYNIRDTPSRLAMVVIPKSDPSDIDRFRREVMGRLMEERTDIPQIFEIAEFLQKFEVIVLSSDAYKVIQAEIDRRVKEGRSLGQLKPKHIHILHSEREFRDLMKDKYGYTEIETIAHPSMLLSSTDVP